MDVDLNPDGPHSPERTAQVGQMFDDCSRYLCYATMAEKHGLDYPADVYTLVADLYSATGRFPQMCAQLEAFMRAQEAAGRLYEARHRDAPGAVTAAVEAAADHLSQAEDAAHRLTLLLRQVQSDISGLGVNETRDA